MTRDETKLILKAIVAVYPAFTSGKNPLITTNVWSAMFADEPYKAV